MLLLMAVASVLVHYLLYFVDFLLNFEETLKPAKLATAKSE